MKWTFGIITCANEDENTLFWRDGLLFTLDSIRSLNIPEYEIIIVGGPYPKNGRNCYRMHAYGDVVHIPFDDSRDWNKAERFKHLEKERVFLEKDHRGFKQACRAVPASKRKHPGIKSGWITKKKNLIWQNAKYENIVTIHDYYAFDRNWYEGFKRFGEDWDFCWNVKHNFWGGRHRDWITWDHPHIGRRIDLPYNETRCVRYQYFGGDYTVGKKSAWEKYPWDESLLHYYADDLEWSFRVREDDSLKLKFNPHSRAYHYRPRYTGDEKYSWETTETRDAGFAYLRATYPEEWE